MTYRELINLYKSGQLDEASKKALEADIEKQEAISEYLTDSYDFSEMDSFLTSSETEEAIESNSFIQELQKNIRKSFIKMGVCVGTALLVMLLFIIFGLPQVVSLFYYRPFKNENLRNDLSAFSELFNSGKIFEYTIEGDNEGYGKYFLEIPYISPIDEGLVIYTAQMNKGILRFNSQTPWNHGTFAYFPDSHTEPDEYEDTDLTELSSLEYYYASITLTQAKDYEEFMTWFNTKNIDSKSLWCAAQGTNTFLIEGTSVGRPATLGFRAQNCNTTKEAVKHMKELISQLENTKNLQFGDTHLPSKEEFERLDEQLTNNPLKVIGFTLIADKETLQQLRKDENIFSITVMSYQE